MARTDKGQAVFEELCDFVREAMQVRGVPGVGLGVVYDGRDFLGGFGVTSVDHPLPVDADTVFQIGSTTKTATATLAMMLAERGDLELDSPVRHYVPELRLADEDAAARVTMRHLLTHRGGWVGDYFADTGNGDDALAAYVRKLAGLPQVTPLAEAYSYSNSAFSLAGRVLEVIAKTPFEIAVKEHVIKPLGMTHSSFFPAEVMLNRFAAGHAANEGRMTVSRPWPIPRATNPAGGIASSARDQLRYARFHMSSGRVRGGEHRILKRASLSEMQAVQADGPLDRKQGLAWILRDVSGARLVLHGGATNGQQSAFLMVPDAGFAITVLTNSSGGARLHSDVAKLALERYLDLQDPDLQTTKIRATQRTAFLGRYEAFMQDIEISADRRGLAMTVLPKDDAPRLSEAAPQPQTHRIAPLGADRFVPIASASEGSQGELLRDDSGKVVWLRFGLRLYRKVESAEHGPEA